MNILFLIAFIFIACLFTGITFFRMYSRTGLKGHLLISLGAIIALIGVMGGFAGEYAGNDRIAKLFELVLAVPGAFLAFVGLILIYTIESGAAQSAYSGCSILDIVLGNVSSLEKKKYRPTQSRVWGMIGGVLFIIYGIVKYWNSYPSESYAGVFFITLGLVTFVISIAALKWKRDNYE